MSYIEPLNIVEPFSPELLIPNQAFDTPDMGGYNPVSPAEAPIISNFPDVSKSLLNKYKNIGPTLAQNVDPAVSNALVNIDIQRVNKGQSPLTTKQTALAILAAQQNAPATKPPGPNILNVPGNALTNLRQLLQSIPQLPMALVKEATSLPKIPGAIAENAAKGMNPISAVLEAPGIRMVPGAYVASNVLKGPEGLSTLATNPLFTALDVLPYAKQLAGLTPAGRIAAAAPPGTFPKMNPIRATLTRKVAEPEVFAATGQQLVPNRVGLVTNKFMTGNPLGRILGETFGQEARKIASIESGAQMRLIEEANPNAPMPKATTSTDPAVIQADNEARAVIQAARDSRSVFDAQGISQQRRLELAQEMQAPSSPNWMDNLTDAERTAVNEYNRIQAEYTNATLASGDVTRFGGEIYDARTGARIESLRKTYDRRLTKMQPYMAQLQPLVGNSPRIQLFYNQLEAGFNGTGTFQEALKTYSGITRGKTRLGTSSQVGAKVAPPADITLARISNIRNDLRNLVAAEKRVSRIEANNVPARFQPLVAKEINRRLLDEYEIRGGDPDLIAQSLIERNYGAIDDWDPKLRQQITREVSANWKSFRDQGLDPIYIHRISPSQEFSLVKPGVPPYQTGLRQGKERTAYAAPYIADPQIGLTAQGMELLRQKIAIDNYNTIKELFGRSEQSIANEFFPQARAEIARKYPGLDPLSEAFGNEVNRLANQYINRNTTIYEPELGAGWSRGQTTGLPTDRVRIPRTVADTLKRMENDGLTKIPSTYDKSMRVFRTSVLALSPRWHVYNIIGGAVMMMGQTNPLTVWKYLGEARNIVKGGFEALPQELRVGMSGAERLEGALQYQAGGALGKMINEATAAKPGLGTTLDTLKGPAQKVSAGFNKVVQASFKFNALFDDMYRTMSYLYGYDKQLTKGMSREIAQRTGIDLAKSTMQAWDSLTPLERSVARNIMPFYSFMQHITRYVINYPMDHPVRASIMASFAKNEIEDNQTGLPDIINAMIPFGGKDKEGNQKYISTRGINPFNDVASFFTLQGLAGNLNPVLSTMLEQLGVDTQTGQPMLAKNMTFDPETGRLSSNAPNPLTSIIGNLIPQSQLLLNLTGNSAEFNALLRNNPEAAQRMITSQAGLPNLIRSYNIPEQQIKAEVVRQDAQDKAWATFLKTGNDKEAKRYPALQPLIEQVKALKASGALSQFQPKQTKPDTGTLISGAGMGSLGLGD